MGNDARRSSGGITADRRWLVAGSYRLRRRTEGAVKSLYHRTLLSLRDELQPNVVSDIKLDEKIEAEYLDMNVSDE
jgi:hypothetical protein